MSESTEKIPIVDFALLGAECYVTDFIQVDNPVLRRIANGLKAKDVDEAIAKAQEYVAKSLEYPLDFRGRPTANRQLKIFKWWNGFYLEEKNQDYGWLKPTEAVVTRKGICFDSACLLTTLLRMLKVEAYTVLGAVLATAKNQVLGFHAWTEAVQSDGKHVVIETTVHPKPADRIPVDTMYTGKLNITYDPFAWFNEQVWREDVVKTRKYTRMMVYAAKK